MTLDYFNTTDLDKQKVAEFLIDNGMMLLRFDKPQKQWFGRKHGITTPVFYDCRSLLRNPKNYTFITKAFKSLISEGSYTNYTIFGVETAGIPYASMVANILQAPLGYIRKKTKGYGLKKLIEGVPPRSSKAVIIDDTCFTGQTLVDSIKSLKRECDISTIVLMCIVTLSDYGYDNSWGYFKKNDIPLLSLTTYKHLNKAALEKGLITKEQHNALNEFYKDPFNYKWNLKK